LGVSENRARSTWSSGNVVGPEGLVRTKVSAVLKNWITTYSDNFVGLMIISLLANLAQLPAVPAVVELAQQKVALSFSVVFFRAVLGGWMINLAVWSSSAANDLISKFVCLAVHLDLCHLPLRARLGEYELWDDRHLQWHKWYLMGATIPQQHCSSYHGQPGGRCAVCWLCVPQNLRRLLRQNVHKLGHSQV
ncbi:unnamed protein product, partial [Polarella glacialis]